MLRAQVLLLVSMLAAAAEPAAGDAGLAELATQRAAIHLVGGSGTRTVQRLDEPDAPSDPKQVRFAVAADGRYDIVLSDPADPGGERTRFASDGTTAWEVSVMAAGEKPLVKARPAANDVIARLFACLRLDLPQLRRDYTVELVAVAAGMRELRLTPSAPALARDIVRIVVTIDAAGRPTRLVLDEPAGNRHRLEVSAFTDEPPADPAWFSPP